MKVAIPVFLDRVSPRLDCARRLLLLDIENDRLREKKEMDISHWPPDEKVLNLKRLGVEQVICGGLRLQDRRGLHRCGIQVASPFFGEVKFIIQNYLNGKLPLSGCRAQNRRRRKRCTE